MKTSRQLKDKIKNLALAKSANAQVLMRSYMMERFLERMALSDYKDRFILKGGVLVAALVGITLRGTMDIDATIKGKNVTIPGVEKMIREIISIPLEDGVLFQVKNLAEIMEDAEYPGIRISMDALFDGTVTPLKVDISTGDIITPREMRYPYKLMLEDRSIEIWSYNIETVLAEKLETIIRRHITNTRMRDFYDIYILEKLYQDSISKDVLKKAILATAKKRGSLVFLEDAITALDEIEASSGMEKLWQSYTSHFSYAKELDWQNVMASVKRIYPK